ncbi:hypothetical protein GP486_007136 [Trichoglossum hirsutum]|uniref:Uncharacterized protein n=1 Tax=Trichoglossum hirsutum TaxID=265104 RepID=A0A9P8ICB9_9PEZI|nr:hypothetical protein GP486_007136 [Trichoglossum hirsutum]
MLVTARTPLLPAGAGRRNITKLSSVLGRVESKSLHRKGTFEEAKAEGRVKVTDDGHKGTSDKAKDNLGEDVSERANAVGDRSSKILEAVGAQKKNGEGSSAEAAGNRSGGQSKILEAVAAQEKSGKDTSVGAVSDYSSNLRKSFEKRMAQEKVVDVGEPSAVRAAGESRLDSTDRLLDLVIKKLMSVDDRAGYDKANIDKGLDDLRNRISGTECGLEAMTAEIPDNTLKYIRTVEEFVEVLFGIVDMLGYDVNGLYPHSGHQDLLNRRPGLASRYQAIKKRRDALGIPHNLLSLDVKKRATIMEDGRITIE